jgi:hypothetical protein
MSDLPLPRLGGELSQDLWHFALTGEHGPLPNPSGHTFPLLTHDADGRWRLIGTGFYISDGGLFVTARHVVEDVLSEGEQISPLVIFIFSLSSVRLNAYSGQLFSVGLAMLLTSHWAMPQS